MNNITLTDDQQAALDAFTSFILDPMETVFVLSGYSGTGKSTLVSVITEKYSKIVNAARLIDPSIKHLSIALTATTNKAAESLSFATKDQVTTIHSFLGLRVKTDYETGVSTVTMSPKSSVVEDKLIFIDEASYIDRNLLNLIFKCTHKCKIVFMGDPAQLTPVKSADTPVFSLKTPGAHLSQVVRQAEGNPIIELSTLFRETVNTGSFFSFTPDGTAIKHVKRDDFNQAIIDEFNKPNWHFNDSKVLGWTNKCAVNFNNAIHNVVTGAPEFQVGDYAICNSFIQNKFQKIKTDQLVCITSISEPMTELGVQGRWYEIDHKGTFFGADNFADRNALVKEMRSIKAFNTVDTIENNWIDLRAAYACTINKAQGSTFNKVFIDLDDIKRCNSGDQIARMMYVGVSRARHQVILTGDLA